MPTYTTIHTSFKLNGKPLEAFKVQDTFETEIADFLAQWQDQSVTITLQTSGSTGTPKTIIMAKQAMVNSALATGRYFNLKASDKALLCLPASYIAGKMMLVRAMVLGLELDCIEPKSVLNIDQTKTYDFAAMVPLQLQKSINSLSTIKHLIVGGAKVSEALINAIQHLETKIYETYGMTETVSHIAIKQLNGLALKQKAHFNSLPNVSITQDNRQCLVIEAPQLCEHKIITNDSVVLHSKTSFEWLGRYDTVINSGGIKIHPEQIENELASKIAPRFFIASEKDETLGERVILIVEGVQGSVDVSILNNLKTYSKPKKIYYVPAFVETTSGKIQRGKTIGLISN